MAKKGGGGPSNQIGEVSIGTSVDPTGAQAGFAKLEGTTKATASRMGVTMAGLRTAFSRIFLPLTVAAGVIRLIDTLDKARNSAALLRKEMTETREDFSNPINLAAYAGRAGINQYDVMRAELLMKASDTRRQIDELAREQLEHWGRIADQNLLGGLFRTMSDKDITKETERQQRIMTDAVEQGLKNIADSMARELAKVLKDHLDKQREQANKYLESIAIDSARHRQIAESMQASQSRGP